MVSLDRSRERVDGIAIAGINDMGFSAAVRGDCGRGFLDALFVLISANDGRSERSQRSE